MSCVREGLEAMTIERFNDEYFEVLPVLAVDRHGFVFGWLCWHWEVKL
jgi:hypothetical protein